MKMEELEVIFKKMLKESEGFTKTDEKYQADMKDIEVFKINWNICGLEGYQIFSKVDYKYDFGKRVDDPDVDIEIANKELAVQFLSGEPIDIGLEYRGRGKFELPHNIGWKEFDDPEKGRQRVRDTKEFIVAQFYKTRGMYSPMTFLKFPLFKNMWRGREVDKNQFGSYIPINQSLGSYENQVLPGKIFKYFIDRASHIVVRDCGCREEYKCKDHDISLGCLYAGDDVLQVIEPVPLNGVRIVSKEEAMEHVQKAIDNGLVPVLGRAVGELEGFGKEDTGHNLSCCFCCSCCCINGKLSSRGSANAPRIFQRLKGLTIEVDQETCVGCGDCLEVCVFRGMEMIDGKAKVNDDHCLGCGRCAEICPNDAIKIELDDMSRLDEFIGKVETYVDVKDQKKAKIKN
jgi:UDP-glucose 4-epimerase